MTRIVLAAVLMSAGLAVVLGGIVFARPAHTEVEVHGAAMAPTLEAGDRVAVEAGADLRRGDLVVVDGDVLRVIGIGGDRLVYADGRLAIDGEPVPEPYADGTRPTDLTHTVAADTVYVASDVRGRTLGGPVPVAAVEGRVVAVNGTLIDGGTQTWPLWVAGGAVVALGGLGWLIVGLHRRTAE